MKNREHGESNPGPEECTSPARGPFAFSIISSTLLISTSHHRPDAAHHLHPDALSTWPAFLHRALFSHLPPPFSILYDRPTSSPPFPRRHHSCLCRLYCQIHCCCLNHHPNSSARPHCIHRPTGGPSPLDSAAAWHRRSPRVLNRYHNCPREPPEAPFTPTSHK